MKISISSSIPKTLAAVVFAHEKDAFPLGLPQQKNLIKDASDEGFTGKENTSAVLHPKSGSPAKQVILVGLGKKGSADFEAFRRAAAAGAKKAQSLSQKSFSILLPPTDLDVRKLSQAISEGIFLSAYKFDKYKSGKKESGLKEAVLVCPKAQEAEAKKGVRLAQIFSDAASFARDLVNEPPSELTPSVFADLAKEVALRGEPYGMTCKIYDKTQIEEMKMGALLGVNRGSAEPPVFIHFHYKPENPMKSIALVGKGITFDSGGLSLKPAQSMETMKMDMAGAASILAVFRALPLLKPKVEVHGILALTENMPGGRASKPGDVLRTMTGKTIEVLNTDAEGRLILADALSYAVQQNPGEIIDLATLTGACVVALGSFVAGAMGNNEDLLAAIQKAGKESGEKFWPLPLVKEYRDGIKSPIADIKNISSVRGEAGSIIGGLFLQEFVGDKPWVHLDIAGPAWTDKEFFFYSQGGTGFPVRTLLHYLLSY